jgi:hypothetical protein
MPKLKPIVARTPEELASDLGLSRTAGKEWQVQHLLAETIEGNRGAKKDHARGDREASRYVANQSDRDPE